MSGRALITGFVGLRPAVVYSTVAPYVEEILSKHESVDICLACSTGPKGTCKYVKLLYGLEPISSLNIEKTLDDDIEQFDKIIDQLIEKCRKYETVYLALKGGMGAWSEKLLYELHSSETPKNLYLLISDGLNVLQSDRHGRHINKKPLKSLGLKEYLKLSGLSIKSQDKPLPKGVSIPDGWIYGGTLCSSGEAKIKLPFLFLFEKAGFLFSAFDATDWIRGTNSYQKDFRAHLQKCMKLGLEKGRILLSMRNEDKASVLQDRASESGIFATISGSPDENRYLRKIVDKLTTISNESNPGNAVRIMGRLCGSPQNIRVSIKKNYACDVLLTAVSNMTSFVNLVAIASHKPKTLIVIYDSETTGTREATCRLSKAVEKQLGVDSSLSCDVTELVETDHLGTGIIEKLEELRKKYTCAWDINLQPGTKEQSFMLIFAAKPGDKLWSMDHVGKKIKRIDTPQVLPQAYPSLRAIATFCGGTLKQKGEELIKKDLDDCGGLKAGVEVFSHLAGISNKVNLTVDNNQPIQQLRRLPIYDDNGNLKILKNQKTLSEYKLGDIFPRFNFLDPNSQYDRNLWFEPVVGTALLEAGADEVICNIQWKWHTGNRQLGFRDELDVATRFGTKLVLVSCKTYLGRNEKLEKDLLEIEYIASSLFGSIVGKPILAVPVVVEKGKEQPLAGCNTRLLGVNRLAHPKSLKEWLLANR